jgi:hypothetical protein
MHRYSSSEISRRHDLRPLHETGPRRLLGALGALAFAALLSPVLPSCSSDAAPDGGAAACEGAGAEACGASCADDSDCAAGLHCASGSCTAECTPSGAECGSGFACSDRGQCVEDPGDFIGGGDVGQSGGGDPGGTCADIDVTFERVVPTVMLLIDQSGSMDQNFGNGSRWDVLESALMDQDTGLVRTLENDVRFGLALYTSHNGNSGGVCPVLNEVSTALGNYDEIRAVFRSAEPDDDTPTAESITAVAERLAAVTDPGPKVIVLATDGEPDTCANPDANNVQQLSVAAAEAAFAQGLKTFVISVGAEVSLAHLQDLANAGSGHPADGSDDAPFYQALDQQSLIDAFDSIISGVRTCVFTLNGTVNDATAGTVLLDGQGLTLNDPNGWRLNNPSEIELVGDACAQVQDGEHTLNVTFSCGTVTDIK